MGKEQFGDECILEYDCDGNEIYEFRVLRFPFSSEIDNWDEHPNVDPRFYCLVKSSKGEVFAVSVYDNYHPNQIRKHEQLSDNAGIPMLIRPAAEMRYYEVAFDGITDREWYYGSNISRDELKKNLDGMLKSQKELVKSKATN